MNSKDLKSGAIFSYLLIAFNTFYGLFFTPFLISTLGEGEYGVYKIIASLIGSLSILDLGIGSTMLRYIAKFYAENDKKNLSNFSAMGFVQAAALSALMIIVCACVYFNLGNFYSEALTNSEFIKAKQLFVLFGIILILNTFEKVIYGIITGCGRFAFSNSIKFVSVLSKVIISFLILKRVADSVVLLLVEIAITVVVMAVQLLYISAKINIKIKLYYWDSKLFGQSFKYTVLMFIQSLAVQMNGSLDNMVIGSVIGSVAVAVYSIGLQLYNMYEQFALAFSNMMLPTVSKQIADGASNKELENTVIKVGRLEFMALGGALAGFVIIGKEFITLWLGKEFLLAWVVAVILMVPTTIPLIQNVSLSILRAKNKMAFRTAVVCIMALFNLIITVVGVRFFGPLAACIGTAISLVAANIIAMNIYYVKVIKLNIFRIFKNVLSRTWLCCLVASGVLVVVDKFIGGNWILWICKAVIFIILYGIMLIVYGLNNSEKNFIFGRFLRR
jgi:O-antigen/teichoic acid export membrane protein